MSSIARVALGVSYCGTGFHGWQYQAEHIPTVQGALEKALSIVADEPIRVTCAGRTDTGVHASAQVVSFTTTAERPDKAWVFGVNAHLPDDISVMWSRSVPKEFDARFSATARRYLYLIYNESIRSALLHQNYTREHRPLDESLMHQSAQVLLGENDFSSFRAANCQSNTPFRNIHHLRVQRHGSLVAIDIEANAFLHHMVRNIAGVLMDVGAGVKKPEWVVELLEARDRSQGSITAAPNGLHLIQVTYPNHPELPGEPAIPHFYQPLL